MLSTADESPMNELGMKLEVDTRAKWVAKLAHWRAERTHNAERIRRKFVWAREKTHSPVVALFADETLSSFRPPPSLCTSTHRRRCPFIVFFATEIQFRCLSLQIILFRPEIDLVSPWSKIEVPPFARAVACSRRHS